MNAVTTLAQSSIAEVSTLLERYGMQLECLEGGKPLPGSYWGDSEAGLLGSKLIARPDTPLHSILHEACHYICMTPERRDGLHTDAGGSDLEECGVCYLQILLADSLPGFGRARMLQDMDAWGYSFRLGSAQAWFERDADDARRWLIEMQLISDSGQPSWHLRSSP